ncbi:MAG TPA: energy-coupled thiamine transporter ThiT [Firmicutes bacterium]|nr:energy-coupled thiamine transporter ThiT [Bacillota bacterium]
MSNFLLFADATEVINILTIVVLALLIVICLVVCVTNKKNPQTTKSIVYGGACVAASFVLSFIKISMNYGGSITLASMLPLFIYCYVFGVGKGLVVGVVYGLLQFIQGPYFLTVPQFLLDYILPFAGICLAGVFKKVMPEKGAIFCGAVLFSILRLAFHIGSGIIWFGMDSVVDTLPLFGSTEAMGAFVYSFLYNAIYMVPETIILLAVLWYLVASKQFFTLEKMLTKVKDEPAKQD